ncbi:hypothetical protein WJX74_006149 [Apatococcus lobatus]|uniref:RHOMBOID-like protein n=1 Tax=Apatococcus lobatus TaxID=904363 RepID=A0AAW1SGR4_9CHLO
MADIELALTEGGAEVAEARVHVPGGHEGLAKFRGAVRAVERGQRLQHAADAVFEAPAGGRDVAGVARLAGLVEREPGRRRLLKALHKREHRRFDSFADRATTELWLTGTLVFHACTPHKLGAHRRVFTWLVTAVLVVLNVYLAGVFPAYLASVGGVDRNCLVQPGVTNALGLWRWIVPRGGFCVPHTLDAPFLVKWGAMWPPYLYNQPWRMWTALFVHQGAYHLITNLALWLLLASVIERRFGWWRLACVWFVGATGGSLFAAAFDDLSTANCGWSGGDFALLAAFVVDLAENFRLEARPILRGLFTVVLLVLLIAGSATAPDVSQWAHVGGFLAGLAPSMVIFPRLGHEHLEAWVPVAGLVWLVALFVSLPAYVFGVRVRGLQATPLQ